VIAFRARFTRSMSMYCPGWSAGNRYVCDIRRAAVGALHTGSPTQGPDAHCLAENS